MQGFQPLYDEGGSGGTGNPNPGAGGNGDSAVIQQMRANLDTMKADLEAQKLEAATLKQERDAALAEKQAFLDKDMSEQERLKSSLQKANDELGELRPLKERQEEADKTFQSLYEKRLADVPEDKRESAKSLTGDGSWASRFQRIETLAKEFVAPVQNGVGKPTNPPGTPIAPGTPGAVKHDLRESGNASWDAVLAGKRGQ